MQIVINIEDRVYGLLKYFEGSLGLADKKDDDNVKTVLMRAIVNGTPLPEGAEILTKEAYSDLCMRASRAESEEENKKEKHTCISCRFYRYDRRTWPCDDCLDYDRWKEVEE